MFWRELCGTVPRSLVRRRALATLSGAASAAASGRVGGAGAGAAAIAAPPLPYATTLTYSSRFATSERAPAAHTFAHAGRYYSLGSSAEVQQAFPGGFAGDLGAEFALAGAHALLLRPVGLALVAHLEHWRQTHGRALAAQGAPVLDVDPAVAYTPPELHAPAELFAPLEGGGGPGPRRAPHPHAAPFRPVRVLTGPRGAGKSGVLNHAVHYARAGGAWLSVLVPCGFAVAHMGKVLAPSPRRRPGFVDQHDAAFAVLKEAARANGDRLHRVPQRGAYAAHRYVPAELDARVSAERDALRAAEVLEKGRLRALADAAGKPWDPRAFRSRYEDAEAELAPRAGSGFTLGDLVAWGLAHPASATDTLLDLLAELRLCTEFPVLVAVDGANHFYSQGPYAMGGEPVPPARLAVQAAFTPMGPDGVKDAFKMKRGLWLLAVSHKHSSDMTQMFGAARIGERYRLPVPPMGRDELHAQLRYYAASGAFFMLQDNPTIEPSTVEYYRTLTGGLPGEVRKAAMFLPNPR